MGKGSPPPPSSTVTQSNLPDYVRPQFERLLTKAEAETKTKKSTKKKTKKNQRRIIYVKFIYAQKYQ